MPFEIVTLELEPDLAEQARRLNGESWPTFLRHSDLPYWGSLFDEFAEYQILFCEHADAVISVGLSIPFVLDTTTDDLPSTMAEHMERVIGVRRNALSALAALLPGKEV